MELLSPVIMSQIRILSARLPETRLSNLDGLTPSWAAKLDLLYGQLSGTVFSNLDLITLDRMAKIDLLESRLSDTWASGLGAVKDDTELLISGLSGLDSRLSSTWSAKLDNTDSNTTTLLGRLTATWAAKLDSLRTGLTDARMAFLDLIDTINTNLNSLSTRLSAAWAAKLDNTDSNVTTLVGRLSSTWAAKVDALRTGLTDVRMSYLDIIPGITAGVGPAPKVRNGRFVSTIYQTGANIVQVLNRSPNITVTGTDGTTVTNNVVNITGSGILKQLFLNLYCAYSSGSGFISYNVKIYIDGYLYLDKTVSKYAGWTYNTQNTGNMVLIGECAPYYDGSSVMLGPSALEEVRFNASLRIAVTIDCTGSALTQKAANVFYDYQTN